MKQKITLLVILLALFSVSQRSFAQVILSEGFEGSTFPPTGWDNSVFNQQPGSSVSGQWLQSVGASFPVSAHTGTGMAEYLAAGNLSVSTADLATPNLNMTTPNATYELSFWLYNYASTSADDALEVYASSTSNITPSSVKLGTFKVDTTYTTPHDTWVNYTINVPNPTNYVIFRGIADPNGFTGNNIYIDDVNISQHAPCSGIPSVDIFGDTLVCAGNSFTLSDTSNGSVGGIDYQWQARPVGTASFVNIPFAISPIFTTSITYPTQYRLIATCTISGMSDTSAIHTVDLNPFYVCYCGPNTNVNLGGSTFITIDSVSILGTTLQNSTPAPLPNNYMSYPASGNTTATLQAGGVYTIRSVLDMTNFPTEAWIDYNHDAFFGPNDWINMNTPLGSNISSGIFTVPANAQLGLTGLRVRSGGSQNPGDPCVNFATGETQDYLVNIIPAPLNDIGCTLIVQPSENSSVCAASDFTVKAVVYNMGTATQSNFIVKANYVGGPLNGIFTVHTDSLASFATDTIVIGNMNIPNGGVYTIKAYTTLANDMNDANDTAFTTVRVVDLPHDPIVMSDTVCVGDTAHIGVTPVAGTVYNWYNAPSGGNIVYTGTSMTLDSLTNNNTYYISASTPSMTDSLPHSVTAGTSGCGGGVMFNITPSNNLTIDSFRMRFDSTGLQPVSVYYRAGSYIGNQTNPNAWIMLGSTAVNVANTSNLYTIDVNSPLQLTTGGTYAIYIQYNAGWSSSGNGSFSDANMTIDYGSGMCGAFTGLSNGKRFDGKVCYHTDGSDCESNRIPVTAAVGPHPVINLGNDDTLCASPSLHLDAGNPGGQYTWSTGDTTQTIHITSSGTYYVTVYKYCYASDTVSVTVLPSAFVSGISYVREAGTNTYHYSPAGAQDVTGYYWTFGDGTSSTLENPVHTYPDDNPYHARLVVFNNCSSDTVDLWVPTAVQNVNRDANAITLYPNPANNQLTVKGSDNVKIDNIVIVNAVGQVVYQSDAKNQTIEYINISKLTPGNYILRATTSKGAYNKLFEIMR